MFSIVGLLQGTLNYIFCKNGAIINVFILIYYYFMIETRLYISFFFLWRRFWAYLTLYDFLSDQQAAAARKKTHPLVNHNHFCSHSEKNTIFFMHS